MGWFRRSAGRHSYGVPVVAAPVPLTSMVAGPDPAAFAVPVFGPEATSSSMLRTPSAAVPPAPPPPAFAQPARLPDNRTSEQIGGKVAEVLWDYYGQQGVSGTPLTAAAAPAALQAYDDAYADVLLSAAPTSPIPVTAMAPPAPLALAAPPAEPPPPPLAFAVTSVVPTAPRYRAFERTAHAAVVEPASPAAPPPSVVAAPPAAAQQPAPAPAVSAAPVMTVPRPRLHVVQLGFLDGSTMDLAGDHPAAKALRAAADALTLRA